MSFLTTPYIGGDFSKVLGMLASSMFTHRRIACFGDSREDFQVSSGGKHSQHQINRLLFDVFGPPSELPFIHHAYSVGSSSTVQAYCQNSLHPYTGGAVVVSNLLPPRYPYARTHTSQHSPLVQLLPWGISRADTPAHVNENGVLQFDPNRNDLVCDVLLKKNTSGPSEIGWIYNPTTTTTQAIFAATASSGASSGLNLNSDNTSVLKWTSPALAYNASAPYAQFKVLGRNSSNTETVADGHVWGMRYRHSTLSRGVSYTSFAVGGSRWNDWLSAIAGTTSSPVTDFGSASAAFALMGPWHITRLAGGVNDYSGNTLDQIEQNTRNFIAAWRTMLGDPNHLIVLEAPYMRENWPSVNYTSIISGIAARYFNIAEDTDNVAFFNVARAMFDEGYTAAINPWSPDAIHLTQFGDYLKAKIVVDFLTGQSKYYDKYPDATSIAKATLAAFTNDPTQIEARINSSISATQSTISASQTTQTAIKEGTRAGIAGRWVNAGTGANYDDISIGDIP
ncbi:hypothetical protein SH449x_004104 [Pirellulaceae bacterium SH449]